jgi:putative PEP-CTERM system histidine kinase
VISTLGYSLAGIAWLLVLLFVLVRRPVKGLSLTGLMLTGALLSQILWAIVLAWPGGLAQGLWARGVVESLRPAMVSVSMIVLLQTSLNHPALRLATGIPMALALAGALFEGLELGTALAQSSALLAAVLALLSVEQVYRNALDDQRWALKFLSLGMGVVFVFDVAMRADALLTGDVDPALSAARGFVNALAAPLIILGVHRLAPSRFRLRLSREVAMHSASLLATGLFLLAMSVVAYGFRLLGGWWGSVLQWVLIFGAATGMLVLIGSGSLRAKARVAIAKHFFSHRYDYRNEWFRLTRMLSSPNNPVGGPALSMAQPNEEAALSDRCLTALTRMVGSPAGRLWVAQPNGAWVVRAGIALDETMPLEPTDALIRFLEREDWIHDVDAWRDGRTPEGCPALPEWLRDDPQAWILMPLRVQSEPIALLQLQRPHPPIPVDWEVRDLLRAAGQQVASMLQVEQTIEALVEARQFESFNRMSAFVVHDLKNLVSQLTLMLKNAERHRADPEFQQDMLDTVTNVLGRMQAMLLQLRSGVTPIESATGIELDTCLRAVIDSRRWSEPVPRLELCDLPEPLRAKPLRVRAHADRLERVIGHLVQNGIEASRGRQRVIVRRAVQHHDVVIQVIDQGSGMSAAFIESQLFKPFRSTKSHGMGIGAFESREYLREIGARLDVQSTPGAGSTFTIHIPLSAQH